MSETPVQYNKMPFRLGSSQPELKFPLSGQETAEWVNKALAEDGAHHDVTSIATVQSDRRTQARLVARQPGVVCGVDLAMKTFESMDAKCTLRLEVPDGARVARSETIIAISGHARCILAAERVALNFMQRLSGVATLTRQYVDAVGDLPTKVLDTRKTTPGWRSLEKYAVRCGGGYNHRMDLASAVLIKDNHLVAVGGDIARAINRAREIAPDGSTIEVECDRIEQVKQAMAAGADVILLDNMTPSQLKECVALGNGRVLFEASGGVTLGTVKAIAATGVNFVSVGGLTHSAPAMNLAVDFYP